MFYTKSDSAPLRKTPFAAAGVLAPLPGGIRRFTFRIRLHQFVHLLRRQRVDVVFEVLCQIGDVSDIGPVLRILGRISRHRIIGAPGVGDLIELQPVGPAGGTGMTPFRSQSDLACSFHLATQILPSSRYSFAAALS
jgi:hypothetical protein